MSIWSAHRTVIDTHLSVDPVILFGSHVRATMNNRRSTYDEYFPGKACLDHA